MKKSLTFFTIVFLLAAIMPFIPIKAAFAHEITAQSSDNASITVEASPVSEPAPPSTDSPQAASAVPSVTRAISEDEPVILPTNPFYFAKEFARSIRMFFTFGRLNKAAYELQVADEKAQELKQVEDLAPENSEGIEKAVDNYSQNVDRLKARLESLKETSSNPNVSALLDNLTTRAMSHEALLEGLKDRNSAIKEKIQTAEENINTAVSEASMKFDSPEQMKARVQKTASDEESSEKESSVLEHSEKGNQ